MNVRKEVHIGTNPRVETSHSFKFEDAEAFFYAKESPFDGFVLLKLAKYAARWLLDARTFLC